MRCQRKIPPSRISVAAKRVKDRSAAARAEFGIVNAIVAETATTQDIDRQLHEIDVRFFAAAIDVSRVELRRHFLPHFEATRADGWTEKCERGARVE